MARLSGSGNVLVVATPSSASGSFVLQASSDSSFNTISASDESQGVKVVPQDTYIRVYCPDSNCEYSLGIRRALYDAKNSETSELPEGVQAQLYLGPGATAQVELCVAGRNEEIRIGAHSHELTDTGPGIFVVQGGEDSEILNIVAQNTRLQARIFEQEAPQKVKLSDIQIKQDRGYVQISYEETPTSGFQLFSFNQAAALEPVVYTYDEIALTPESVPQTLCGARLLGQQIKPDTTQEGSRTVLRFYYPQLTRSSRFVLADQQVTISGVLQYNGVITDPESSETAAVVAASVLIGSAVFAVLLLLCISGRKATNDVQHNQFFKFPAGYDLVDNTCGWSVVQLLLSGIISFLLALYYTWQLNTMLHGQSLGLSDPTIQNVTLFIFTSNQNDAFVHSWHNQNGRVTQSFSKGVLDIHIGEFSSYGTPTLVKAFVNISANQLGAVGDVLEYDFDLAAYHKQSLTCQLIPTEGHSYQAGPEIKIKDVDVQVYRNPNYLTQKGSINQTCTWKRSPSTQAQITIQYDALPGKPITTDLNVVLRVLLLGLFGVVLAVSSFILLRKALGSIMILRKTPEEDRQNLW